MYNMYSYRKKRPTGLIITIIICLIIVLATGFFIYINLTTPLPFKEKEVANKSENEIVINKPQTNDVKYDKNAEFMLTETFLCGHNKETNTSLPENFIGKTITEIKKENPDYIITSYNDFSVSALKVYDKHCDNHYIIKLNGTKLISFNKNSPDVTIKEIKMNLAEYPSEDIEILKNGIEVGSKEEMLEFFEDFA